MPIYSNMPEDFYPRPSDVNAPLRSTIGIGPRGPKGHSITAEIIDNDPYGYFRIQFKDVETGEVLVTTPNLDVGSRFFVYGRHLTDVVEGDTEVVNNYDFTSLQASSDRSAIRVGDIVLFTTSTTDETFLAVDTVGIGVVNSVNGTQVSFIVTNVMTAQLRDGSITTDMLANFCVTTAKLANEAVTTDKLSNESVTTEKIVSLSVTTDKLAQASVTNEKIADTAVDTTKLANGAVTTEKIDDDAVTEQKIVNDAVTSNKIKEDSINTDHLKDNVVTTQKIASGAVTTDKIPDGNITNAKIANNNITDSKLVQNGGILEHFSELKDVVLYEFDMIFPAEYDEKYMNFSGDIAPSVNCHVSSPIQIPDNVSKLYVFDIPVENGITHIGFYSTNSPSSSTYLGNYKHDNDHSDDLYINIPDGAKYFCYGQRKSVPQGSVYYNRYIDVDYTSDIIKNLADEFDISKYYETGDIVTYNNDMHILHVDHDNNASFTSSVRSKISVDTLNSIMSNWHSKNANLTDLFWKNKHSKLIKSFFRIANVGTAGITFVDSGNRSVTLFKGPGTFCIRNKNGVTFNVWHLNPTTGGYDSVDLNYTTQSFAKVNLQLDTTYGITAFIGGHDTITNEDLKTINDSISIYQGEIVDEDVLQLKHNDNLIEELEYGYYIHPGTGQPDYNNDTVCGSDYIPVSPNETYYMPNITVLYAWYDQSKRYISGEYIKFDRFNSVSDRPKIPYITRVAPLGARYIRVSFRDADRYEASLSRVSSFRSHDNKSLMIASVPRSKVISENITGLMDYDFTRSYGVPSRLHGSDGAGWTVTDAGLVNNDNGSRLLSWDLMIMSKSIMQLIYSASDDYSIDFGFDASKAGFSSMPGDSLLVVNINSSTSTATVYRTGEWYTRTTVVGTIDLSNILLKNSDVCISIEKDTIYHQVIKVYNSMCPNAVAMLELTATVNQSDNNFYDNTTRCWGGPRVQIVSGEVTIRKLQAYSTAPKYPKIAMFGDSIVENIGKNPNCGYGYLLKEALHGDMFMSGFGGADTNQLKQLMASEIRLCSPEYTIIQMGGNDCFRLTKEQYLTNITDLCNMVKDHGSEPIITTTIICVTDTHNNTEWLTDVNPQLRELGYKYIDLAYIMSTGDGLTPDYSKFVGDKTHPNLLGGQAIMNYIRANLPELLY